MANSKIPNLNLSDTLNTQRLKFNQLLDSVGDVSTLTTTGTNVTAAINELDAELGTISGRLDSINTTELLSPRATLTDSSATSIVRGNLQVDTNLHVNGNTTNTGSVTIDGLLTTRANVVLGNSAGDQLYVISSINTDVVPYTDNAFDLGSPTKEWRHVYVDGTVNADNVAADSATIGTLTVTGDTTFNNAITVQDSAYITGNLAVGGNTTMAGTLTVDGQVTFKAGSDNNIALGDAATDTITLTGEVNSNIIPDGDNDYDLGSPTKEWRHVYVDGTVNTDNLAADSATIGTLTVTGDTTLNNTITVQDSAYITGDLDLGSNLDVAGNVNVTGTVVSQGALTVEDSAYVTGNLDVGNNLTVATAATLASAAVSDLTNDRIVVVGASGELEDDGNLTWNGSTLDITGDLSVSAGFTVGGTFTTTGNTRGEASFIVVNDGVAVANGNRAGLAVDRPSNDSAIIQWNELGDYWEAGTTAGVERLALQTDSAAFHNLYAGGTLTVLGNTTLKNALTVQDSAYVTGNLEVGGNLTVQGTTTILNTETIEIEDNVMLLNSNQTGIPANSVRSGLEVERGSYTNVNLQWNENSSYWEAAEDSANTLGRIATSGWLDATAPISFNSSTGNISHNNTTRTNTTTAATLAHSDAFEVVDSIQSNSKGHITGVNTRTITLPAGAVPNDGTITISGGTDLETGGSFTTDQAANETITLNHSDTTRTNTTTAATLAHSDAFEVVDSIQSNARGHITGVNTRTITLPAGAVPNDATITISGGTDLETGGSFTTDQSGNETITLNHSNTTRTNVSTSESPGYGGSFDVVDSIQSNARGHITQVATRTITLPASDNSDTLQSIATDATATQQYITFVPNTSGAQTGRVDADLTYNPSSNYLYVKNITNLNTIVADNTNPLVFKNNNRNFTFQGSSENTTSRPPIVNMFNNVTTPTGNMDIGTINFITETAFGSVDTTYAAIHVETRDTSDGTEDGKFIIQVANDGDTTFEAFKATGSEETIIKGAEEIILDAANGIIDLYHAGAQDVRLDVATTDTLKLYTGTTTLNSTFSGDDLTVQGDITSISDIRTKENIETIENSLELVESLRGVYYNKIGEEDRKVGVIAQETEEVLPEVVMTDQEGMKSVDYGKMVGVLIEAIKDLKAEVEELKANKCNCGE
jgi:cytoskeletal protein CcmA (bactofilin family)